MNGQRYRVEVMHGVNLDQLGRRDPRLYGTLTLPELQGEIESEAHEHGLAVRFFQTNYEAPSSSTCTPCAPTPTRS